MTDRTDLQLRLLPPQGKGNTSAARVTDDWYILCRSAELKAGKPLDRTLLGMPLAVYRDASGQPGVLLDRCPHRNVPLTLGEVVDGDLQCAYHGWRFDRSGECTRVPGLCGEAAHRGRRVPAFATREQEGFVWVYGEPDVEPAREPYRFPHLGEDGWHAVYDVVEADATVHAVAENALDVPHTAFLHGGLFRNDSAERKPIEVVVRRWHDRIEAQYIGEARPEGLVGRILAPQGGEVEHYDRFLLPGITEVEYRLSDRSHIVVSSVLTPVSDFHTRLFSVVSFKLPLPAMLVKLLVRPIARHIFGQDKTMLAQQTAAIEHFGGERYISTELDALGPGILRLLRAAERGDRKPLDEPVERRFTMMV